MIDALLSAGGVLAAEGPNKTILPGDINEVWWASSAFIVVMTLLVWKAGPAIKNAWNARIQRISGELDEDPVRGAQPPVGAPAVRPRA